MCSHKENTRFQEKATQMNQMISLDIECGSKRGLVTRIQGREPSSRTLQGKRKKKIDE